MYALDCWYCYVRCYHYETRGYTQGTKTTTTTTTTTTATTTTTTTTTTITTINFTKPHTHQTSTSKILYLAGFHERRKSIKLAMHLYVLQNV